MTTLACHYWRDKIRLRYLRCRYNASRCMRHYAQDYDAAHMPPLFVDARYAERYALAAMLRWFACY